MYDPQYVFALEKRIQELQYRSDRNKMNGDAAAHLAEYRMHRIFELEDELKELKDILSDIPPENLYNSVDY